MLRHPLAKLVFFIFCLLPMVWIIWNALWGDLGANPVETVTHQTGDWTLRLLLITLSISPLKRLSGIAGFVRFRRMSGLFVYFYACCHFLVWFVADHSLNLSFMLDDIIERPFITVGFLAFVLLSPLALTSNKWSMRKLGKKWKNLHQLVYIIITLAIVHFLWLVKADYLEPMIYALIAIVLLLLRLDRLKLLYGRFETKMNS